MLTTFFFNKDVFSVPLYESLQIANTHIAYEDRNTIIGSIPIVVAKCGSFLKDQGSVTLNIYQLGLIHF